MPASSAQTLMAIEPTSSTAITAISAKPWRRLPTIRPYMSTLAKAIENKAQVERKLVSPLGFSKGCAELVLKKPPPLLPSCLMAI